MHMTRRELLKSGAALGVTAALGQALPQPAQAQTTQKKELVTAQGGDIARFDPHFSTSSNDIRCLLQPLRQPDQPPSGRQALPGLATEWKLQGQTTWAFKLRQGVKFHNGDPFTSADAKFSIERTYDPAVKTMVATALSTIDRIEAPDPYHAHHPPQEAGPAPAGAPGLLRRPDRAEEIPGVGRQRHVQRQAGGHGPSPVRVMGQGRPGGVRRQPRLLGSADRCGPLDHAGRSPRRRRGVAALLKGEVDIITQLPPDQAERDRAMPRRGSRARSTPGSTCSA